MLSRLHVSFSPSLFSGAFPASGGYIAGGGCCCWVPTAKASLLLTLPPLQLHSHPQPFCHTGPVHTTQPVCDQVGWRRGCLVWGGAAVLPSLPHQPMKGPWVGEGKNLTVLPISPLAEITPLKGSMRMRGTCWLVSCLGS